jgi:hypothetical protein
MEPNKVTNEEFTTLQKSELTQDELIRRFVTQVDHNYQSDGYYYPDKDASYNRKEKDIFGYTINYSFPVNMNTPVASFWTFNEADYDPDNNRSGMSIFHIDIHKLVSHFVKQANDEGYKPPLAKGRFTAQHSPEQDETTH